MKKEANYPCILPSNWVEIALPKSLSYQVYVCIYEYMYVWTWTCMYVYFYSLKSKKNSHNLFGTCQRALIHTKNSENLQLNWQCWCFKRSNLAQYLSNSLYVKPPHLTLFMYFLFVHIKYFSNLVSTYIFWQRLHKTLAIFQ